ncbi:MAG: YihY/virulence factor BrkB family protein [Firmicutes bacterium]|nr:YihY/virulence factor BrkB family protein [Bacillota bacterium]
MKTKIKEFFQRIYKVLKRPDMILLPGQLAFFLVLAIIPTMTLITYGASVLNLSIDFLYDFLAKAFSSEIAELMLSTSSGTNIGLKLTVVIIVCYYLSSNGAASVIVTSNTIYGVKNGNWFQRRFKAIVISIIFVFLLVCLLIVPIFGDQIVGLIKAVNLNTQITNIIVQIFKLLKNPVMWIFLFFLIKIIYVLSPDRKIVAHNANYGAIFTTIAWIIMTELYSFYINNLADYTAFYGGLTSICVLMMWFYFLAYFFVVGMSLNYQKEADELEKTGVIKTNK